MRTPRGLTVLLALWTSCAPVTGLEPDVPSPTLDTCATCLSEADIDALLFDGRFVSTIELTLGPHQLASLNASPQEWVSADARVEVGGTVLEFPGVGVKLKGAFSFRTLDKKAAFTVRLDKYRKGQKLGSLTKLALNNMIQDPSTLSEALGYRLFGAVGLPAGRSGHARVKVNGELFGLYALGEKPDNDATMTRLFGQSKDILIYEGAYGADLPSGDEHFELEHGDDESFETLHQLMAQVSALEEGPALAAQVDELFDLQHLLRFVATEVWLGHRDGFLFSANNYYLVRRPDHRWELMPWGLDWLHHQNVDPYGEVFPVLMRKLLASPSIRLALYDELLRVEATASAMGLREQAVDLKHLVADAVAEDPRREHALEVALGFQALWFDWIDGRAQQLASFNQCGVIEPAPDFDHDGVQGCGFDCDDSDPLVHPGAEEQCNDVDDDCDGEIDEGDVCERCQELGAFLFCPTPRTWAEAEAWCVSKGRHLVSIPDEDTVVELETVGTGLSNTPLWIGAISTAPSVFSWSDDSPFDVQAWAEGEPDRTEAVSCVELLGSRWRDTDCGDARGSICGPLP